MTVVRKIVAILSNENFTVNFLGACTSGVLFGAVMEDVVNSGYFQPETFIKFVVLSAGSYILSTLFFHRSRLAARVKAPRWVLIAIAGSIMSAVTTVLGAQWPHIFAYIVDSNPHGLWNALGNHLIPVTFLIIMDTLIACVISGLVMSFFHLFGVVIARAHARRA